MKFTHIAPVALAAAMLSLAACGGGGGSKPAAMTPAPETMPEAPTPAPEAEAPSVEDRNRILAADPAKALESARRAAVAGPRFGSVTQSTNARGGVTTDRAGADFDGTGLTVKIAREGSSTLTLDTADAIEGVAAPDAEIFNIPGAARILREWSTLNVTGSTADLAVLSVSYVDGDPDDWVSFGVWMHLDGSGFGGVSPTVTNTDIGAFVDGPEFRSPPNLPGTGIARYEGVARGIDITRYGTGVASFDIPSGSTDVGTFIAIATLTADFADNTIRGCIGCKGDVLSSGVFTDAVTGEETPYTNERGEGQLRLGSASINADGTFSSGDTTILPDPSWRNAGLSLTQQDGSWGGKFSNIPVAQTGNPSLVAGTFGLSGTMNDGTQGISVGFFGAGPQ